MDVRRENTDVRWVGFHPLIFFLTFLNVTYFENWYSQDILQKKYFENFLRKSEKTILMKFASFYIKNFHNNESKEVL
jgi:hypothetical protein